MDQLIHSERLAAVGQLASGVAHELNNPLQAIVGFTELLMPPTTGRRRDDLEHARAAATVPPRSFGTCSRSSVAPQ